MAQIIELPDGRRASYHTAGKGMPALMAPGGPGFAASYLQGDAELFADLWSCYLVDPPGAGGSTPPLDPSGYSAGAQARFLEEVRKALGLSSVVVFGHSFGATVALTYAATYPQSTAACVAVAPFAVGAAADAADGGPAAAETEAMVRRHAGSPWYPGALEALEAFDARVAAAKDSAEMDQILYSILPFYLARPDEPEIQEKAAELSGLLKTNLAAVQVGQRDIFPTIDIRPVLSRVSCPTLVIAGEYDFICGPGQATPIANAVGGAKLRIFPGCGHLPILESPREYRRAVAEFIRGLA